MRKATVECAGCTLEKIAEGGKPGGGKLTEEIIEVTLKRTGKCKWKREKVKKIHENRNCKENRREYDESSRRENI